MDIIKKLKLVPNLIQAVYFLAVLFVVGFLSDMVGFGDFLYKFPVENFLAIVVTFTLAGVVKSYIESMKGVPVPKVSKARGFMPMAQRGIFDGIFLTIGLFVVGLLAGVVGLTEYLLDFQVLQNIVPLVITLSVAAIGVAYAKTKFKM